MKRSRLLLSLLLAVATLYALAPSVSASIITATLTGDFRPDNPDNLIVDVTINFSGDTASWLVDINSPLHSEIKLDQFYFNLALDPGQLITFSNFSPNDNGGAKQWAPVPSTNAAGSGGADFNYGVGLVGGGEPNTNQVNNSKNLTFNIALNTGSFTESMFFNATLSTGGGIPSPGAQLGAHLQSLGTNGEDSGFASGNHAVPEPATMLLLGSGLLGLVGLRRKSRKN